MGFEDNIRMKKIINEQLESNKQKYSALELKTHEKGFIENFYNILNINQKVSLENYCILFCSPTFVSTSNILINAPFRTRGVK